MITTATTYFSVLFLVWGCSPKLKKTADRPGQESKVSSGDEGAAQNGNQETSEDAIFDQDTIDETEIEITFQLPTSADLANMAPSSEVSYFGITIKGESPCSDQQDVSLVEGYSQDSLLQSFIVKKKCSYLFRVELGSEFSNNKTTSPSASMMGTFARLQPIMKDDTEEENLEAVMDPGRILENTILEQKLSRLAFPEQFKDKKTIDLELEFTIIQ